MTIITTVRVPPSEALPSGAIVAAADCMGSYDAHPGGREKEDDMLKLVAITDRFTVLGTGSGAQIQGIQDHFAQRPPENSGDLAKAVYRVVSEDWMVPVEKRAQFVVSGAATNGTLASYHVLREPTPFFTPTTGYVVSPVHLAPQVFFDGSGIGQVHSAWLQAQKQTGKYSLIMNVAHALEAAYDIVRTAAGNRFVDDKLQLAIVTDKGVSTLYHPDVSFDRSPHAYVEHLQRMTGAALNADLQGGTRAVVAEAHLRNNAALLLRGAYDALVADVAELSDMSRGHTGLSEFQQKGEVDPAHVQACLDERNAAETRVNEGARLIIERGAENLSQLVLARAGRLNRIATEIKGTTPE